MVYLSQIYTKSGDTGHTGLGDGTRVAKNSLRVTAYGEVDELNAVIGLLLSLPDLIEPILLRRIQNELFDLGADLCVPYKPDEPAGHSLRITAHQVTYLEKAIDRLNNELEPLTSFILPGGTPSSAWLHLARTVCRRAERSLVALMQTEPINEHSLIYLNRLSDLFFVMSRTANGNGQNDVLWVPGQSR